MSGWVGRGVSRVSRGVGSIVWGVVADRGGAAWRDKGKGEVLL